MRFVLFLWFSYFFQKKRQSKNSDTNMVMLLLREISYESMLSYIINIKILLISKCNSIKYNYSNNLFCFSIKFYV